MTVALRRGRMGRAWDAVTWWWLGAQFSRPVLLVSPRRRRIVAEIEALYSCPDFAEEWSRRLTERIQCADGQALLAAILGEEQ